ncbi:uncharacterized protein MICPUCDRAFT_60638 [Micromonas pusilla CCMP1545]|uniref:Predicted protein n=1 Tax=Micromonas pusilla (strain CCMP1545) TaxID=564608 RepID=C1MZ83_MICPC|nr:uncharacterized protein MICPUCDRAFT_60638 [Micromonas pusilla CCMP1545]EEH54563.1 predicted protein [Micromonas pusilla CCMP1545]|eukprot:XP_003060913.1 predicted protein [Micromonas pusilla CCMP1545]
MAFGVNDMTFGARDVLPVRSRTRQGHELTADELEAAAKDLDVYPPVSASISRFSETRAPGPRAAYAERHRAGCDTSAQPIYSKPPTSEPNVEDAGALWHEERGREGRRVTFHGHPPDDESGVEAELRPGEMRPAGLA